jgi:hypothetical protein
MKTAQKKNPNIFSLFYDAWMSPSGNHCSTHRTGGHRSLFIHLSYVQMFPELVFQYKACSFLRLNPCETKSEVATNWLASTSATYPRVLGRYADPSCISSVQPYAEAHTINNSLILLIYSCMYAYDVIAEGRNSGARGDGYC